MISHSVLIFHQLDIYQLCLEKLYILLENEVGNPVKGFNNKVKIKEMKAKSSVKHALQ